MAAHDRVVRDVASLGIVCDLDAGIEVRHELVATAEGQEVRCSVADATGLVYREDFALDHGCLSCTVREGLVPTLRWIAEQGRWRQALVTLPVTASPEAVAWQLATAIDEGDLDGVRLAHALAVVDQRAVGEALSSQLDYSDTVVTLDAPDAACDALLEHVLPPEVRRVSGLGALDVAALFAGRHDVAACQDRLRPTARTVRCEVDRAGVWTLELCSDKPFHPQRLLDQVERLGAGAIRARGCFWLPSRPGEVCVWDASGGQLSIGEAGPWDGRARPTHLVVTGIDADDAERIRRAFDEVLVTDAELPSVGAHWVGCPDGLEPWLGEREELGQVG